MTKSKGRKVAGSPAGSNEEPGEGNHEADRRYRDATKRFIDEGKVEPAAKNARHAIDDDKERAELEKAEELGRARAAEHDPETERH
jgi:hypothetical protein